MSLFGKAKEALEKNKESRQKQAEEQEEARIKAATEEEARINKQKEIDIAINKIQIYTGADFREYELVGSVKGYGFTSHDPMAFFSSTTHDDSEITRIATEAEGKAARRIRKQAYELGANAIINAQYQNLSSNQIIDLSIKILDKSSAKVNSKLVRETFVYGTAVKISDHV